jgi:hypothetical protein
VRYLGLFVLSDAYLPGRRLFSFLAFPMLPRYTFTERFP